MGNYFLRLLVLSIVLSSSTMTHAAVGYKKGKVEYIRSHNTVTHSATWAPPNFWFTLEGVSSAGTCKTWHGNVLFAMDNEQSYSMILSAYMADKEISIRYDDANKNAHGWCNSTHVTVGNPPPLF